MSVAAVDAYDAATTAVVEAPVASAVAGTADVDTAVVGPAVVAFAFAFAVVAVSPLLAVAVAVGCFAGTIAGANEGQYVPPSPVARVTEAAHQSGAAA